VRILRTSTFTEGVRVRRSRRAPPAALVLASVLVASCGSLDFSAPLPAPVRPQPSRWQDSDLNVAYVGHASVLIGFGPARILTDPAFFDRIGVQVAGITFGPKRRVAAALTPEELPPLDAVLISHAHLDSLDRPSLARLAGAASVLVVPERTRDVVDDLGFARVMELGWGERVVVDEVEIEAIEVSHWGRRWPWERWRGYNGYLLERGETRVLFASDTAYAPAIGETARARQVEVMILGNGAYDPWIANHADPEQVWRMFSEGGARYLVPVHWDTFRLGREPVGDAMTRLLAAAADREAAVVVRQPGETWTLRLEDPGATRRDTESGAAASGREGRS
jgi:L-ascorbate metabolism protein UlaG (beta-lactamase superfamily)